MEISKRYNLTPVKDNCALFAPTSLFSGPRYPMVSFKFLFADLCCHGNEFWDKVDHNSAPVKDKCDLFALTFPLYVAVRLYSVAMGQIPRSTERIFSYK